MLILVIFLLLILTYNPDIWTNTDKQYDNQSELKAMSLKEKIKVNEEKEQEEEEEKQEETVSSKSVSLPDNVNLLKIKGSIESKLPKLEKYCIGILAPEYQPSNIVYNNEDITI